MPSALTDKLLRAIFGYKRHDVRRNEGDNIQQASQFVPFTYHYQSNYGMGVMKGNIAGLGKAGTQKIGLGSPRKKRTAETVNEKIIIIKCVLQKQIGIFL
jgi:hypothetical protein